MAEQILSNPAALNALKRHQLVSLSKRYGLKASGKNGDMIERLLSCKYDVLGLEYSSSLDSTTMLDGRNIELPALDAHSTPLHPNADFVPAEPASPTPMSPAAWIADDKDTPMFSLPVTSKLDKKASMISVASENWDRMSASGASFISPMKGTDQGSVRSWKSAGNGQPLSDFAPAEAPDEFHSSSSRKSVLAFASSLKRSGTKTFLGSRSTSQSSNLTVSADEDHPEPEEPMESIPIPPSPASTVGIPRRHSKLSLFERPSTLRLCSPTLGPDTPRKKGSDLPFVGSASKLQELKARRSMAPLRSAGADPDHFGLSRKSMPALNNYTSASLASIYPPLPGFQADSDAPPVPPMPGYYPTFQRLKHQPSETFVFGSPHHGVSSAKFSDFSQALLQEINDKLPEEARMGGEVLKGKQADMKRMVSVTSGLGGGEGGWGLMEAFEGKRDRFAAAHEREFSKMSSISQKHLASSSNNFRSMSNAKSHLFLATPGQKRKHSAGSTISDIPSAPNGSSMDREGRQAKRSRMSPGPNVLGSLRDAGRSVMTLLGDGEGRSPEKRRIAGEKRQRSRLSFKGNGLRSRLSLFRTNFRRPAGPRPGEMTAQERSAQLQTALRRRSAEFSNIVKRTPDLPINPPMSLRPAQPRGGRDRMPSSSAQTVMSSASSKIPQRKPLPDFGGRIPSASSSRLTSSVSSTSALGLPKPNSSSLSSNRKQSQADLIRNARRAPAPPSAGLSLEAPQAPPLAADSARTTSTLYASTASSRARMQATVKPTTKPTSRPLPMAPPPPSASMGPPSSFRPYGIATSTDRFGAGESRENLFEENFQQPPPTPSSPAPISPALLPSRAINGGTPGRSNGATSSPLKPAAASSRIRHKNSTLSAIKSRGNLREEVDVQRRKAEIRAKADRRNEEKELRQMLGGLRDDGAV